MSNTKSRGRNDFREYSVIVPAAFVPALAFARFVRDSPRHDMRNAMVSNTLLHPWYIEAVISFQCKIHLVPDSFERLE